MKTVINKNGLLYALGFACAATLISDLRAADVLTGHSPIQNGTVNLERTFVESALIPGVAIRPAPTYSKLLLKPGDRLAICGDSITEQKMYSRIIEDYLVMCTPELDISVRQYGWGGERAPGFLARMTNDVLRFQPTVATTCYGMNDHEYRAFEERIGSTYSSNSIAIVQAFRQNGARVIQGSPGCVGKLPGWIKQASTYRLADLNANLARLRNLGLEVADTADVRFADVFMPMLVAWHQGQHVYGPAYAIPGSDGVHPGWAGQLVMAYSFLSAMGLDGEIGTFIVNLKSGEAAATQGHHIKPLSKGVWEITSSKYPFCFVVPEPQAAASYPVAGRDDYSSHNSLRSVLGMVPFNEELNRLTLKVKGAGPGIYRVTWGNNSRYYGAQQLKDGINLAAEFSNNPFGAAFSRVDAAVYARQAYETQQIKKLFRSPEAKADMEAVVKRTESEREPLAKAVKDALQPVTHTITIQQLK